MVRSFNQIDWLSLWNLCHTNMKENTLWNRIELLFSLQTKLLSLNKIESSVHDSFCFDFDYILKPPGLADEPKYSLPHRGFLEHWNSQKSVCNIWKCFSCLLHEGIPKIWKKLNSHGGFLRADQGSAKMCCQMGWIGCAILQVAQKAIVRIQFLAYFWNPLIK